MKSKVAQMKKSNTLKVNLFKLIVVHKVSNQVANASKVCNFNWSLIQMMEV